MSRQHYHNARPAAASPLPVPDPMRPNHAVAPDKLPEDSIPEHRRCPRCWGTMYGVGVSYNSPRLKLNNKRYYKCKRLLTGGPGCGWTWVVTVTTRVISMMVKEIEQNGDA